jgi:uncharacterized membrane protein YdbT with pleckstrin-like domain
MSFTKNQLLPGENLIVLTHQHPIVLLKIMLLNVFAAVILGILSFKLDRYWILLFYLVPLASLLWEMLVRQKKEYIITDHRVVKQEGVISISSFDAPLDKINNVFYEQTVLGRILNYGKVGLETASEQGTTIFEYIPHPVKFKNCVVQERQSYRSSRGSEAQVPATENLPRLLEELASLRDRKIITPEEFEAKKKALLNKL